MARADAGSASRRGPTPRSVAYAARFGHWRVVVIRLPPRRSSNLAAGPPAIFALGQRLTERGEVVDRSTASPARGPRKCQPGRALVLAAIVSLPPWGRHSPPPSPTCTPTLAAPKTCALLPPASSAFHSPEIVNSTHWGGQAILAVPSPFKTARTSRPAPPLCRAPLPIQRGAAPKTLHPAFPNWHVRQEP